MSSPFSAQLGTNYCPTDAEVLEIRSLLVEPTRRIKHLDDEIAELQNAIDKLVAERDSLGAYIFVACLPTHRNCVMSAAEAPVLLGRICSAWRAISLTTPRLWSKLHLAEPEPPQRPYQLSNAQAQKLSDKIAQRVEVTKMWLGRSGQCPLSLSLLGASKEGAVTEGHPATVQLLRALIESAGRWQHIDFTIHPSLLFGILSYLETDMPLLQTVALKHHPCREDLQGIECGSFKMLRGTRMSTFSIPGNAFAPDRFPLSWNQLTNLTIDGPARSGWREFTSEMVLGLLSRCPKLQCVKVAIGDTTRSLAQHPMVELPFLHTFSTPVLFNHLSLPELHHFTLLGTSGEMCPTLPQFLATTVRLESFETNDKTLSSTCWWETLHNLPPTLHRLSIRAMDGSWRLPIGDDTLEALVTPGICPALQDLSIERGSNLSDAAVLQFITTRMQQSRTSGGMALRRVEIQFRRQMIVDIMPSLQPFLETGLTVSLIYLPIPPWQFSPWQGLTDAPDA
ncbi:hypothetical protein B0H14DRAFT_2844683 [Mycena olivaceomarginata]|nr:hypothetical protein B0H14DRAFT_2844683 [Mycena olivaceomarginata]